MKTLRAPLLLAIATALVVTGGCSRKYFMAEEQAQGEIQPTAAVFSGRLDVLWEADFKGKPSAPLAVENGVLAVPSSRGRIAFFDWETGQRLGHLKSRGPVQTGLAQADTLGLLAIGPPKNRVVAYDLLRHDEIWRRPILDAAPSIAIAGDRAVAASAEGLLMAWTVDSGEPLWTFRDSDRFVAAPVVHDEVVFQPDDNGLLFAIALESGEEIFRTDLGDPIVSAVTVADVIVAATVTGRVIALAPENGRVIWDVDLGGENWTSPAVADDIVVAILSRGIVVALDVADGSERWRFDTEQAVRASPLIVDSVVLVATLGGRLSSLALDDGSEIARRDFSKGIPFAPVTDGHRVVVATRSGDLICVGDGQTAR